MFGSSLVFKPFDLGLIQSVLTIGGPGPAQMVQSPAMQTMEKSEAPSRGMATAPAPAAAESVPLVQEAAPVVAAAPAAVVEQAPVAKAPAAEPAAQGGAGWPAFGAANLPLLAAVGFLVLLILGLVLIAPRLQGRLPSRGAGQAPDTWARLDRMVAREQALAVSRSLPA
jgi:hypothetical protein